MEKKNQLFSIKNQLIFLFIPLINLFAVYVMTFKNIRKLKCYFSFFVATIIGVLFGALLTFLLLRLDFSKLGLWNIIIRFFTIYVIILAVLIPWIIVQHLSITKLIQLEQVVIIKNKIYLQELNQK